MTGVAGGGAVQDSPASGQSVREPGEDQGQGHAEPERPLGDRLRARRAGGHAARYRTDAWRVVYVTEVEGRLWVIHAFRKKSKTGIRMPRAKIDLIGNRLARLIPIARNNDSVPALFAFVRFLW